MKCHYCNEEAKYKLKNGNYCCSKNYQGCSAIRKKNSETQKKLFKGFEKTGHDVIRKCKWCNYESTSCGIGHHEPCCYLNPINKKLCPICGKPIKNYKKNATCSKGCANTFFRARENSPHWAEKNHRLIAFDNYPHECEICGYNKHIEILEVHHIDSIRSNNKVENLIILCPNCHASLTRNYAIMENRKIIWK